MKDLIINIQDLLKVMTYNNKEKRRAITVLMAMAFAFAIVAITPTASADNPPYKYDKWFQYAGDPEVCYLESELNNLIVDGSTGNGQDVKNEVEDTRAHYNSVISGLTIAAEDNSCSYNRIEIGAKNLPFGVMAQDALTAYYIHPNFKQHAEHEIDFDTTHNWKVESNACDWFHDKDIEWLANHEFGHALSLNHHSGSDHSVMKSTCTSKYSAIQTADDSALEARY